MRTTRGHLLLAAAALLLVQAVWIVSVPPFRASDEFDHAYRAAGVARGQWLLDEPAAHGRGVYVDVPVDIVLAAGPECASLNYTLYDNCHPARMNQDGTWTVATAAGPYNPLYYWVVGTAALPFQGDAALYAMRIAGALLCCLVLLAAIAVTLSQRPGRWEALGLAVGLTPVLMFSTAMAAPNGLEMAAGLLTWAALLALARNRRPELTGRYLAAAASGAALLGLVRMLGPVWLLLIAVVVLVYGGLGPWLRLWREHRRGLVAGVLASGLGVLAGGAWVVVSGWYAAQDVPEPLPTGLPLLLTELSGTWVMQLIAAFPYRDLPSPLAVYPTMMVVVVTGLVVALRRGRRAERSALALAIALTVVAPLVITVLTIHDKGLVWQGRYALAFVVGVMPLCGMILDRSRWAPQEGRRLHAIAGAMLVAVNVMCIHRVVASEDARGAADGRFVFAHPPVVVLDALIALAILALIVATDRVVGPRDRPDAVPDLAASARPPLQTASALA